MDSTWQSCQSTKGSSLTQNAKQDLSFRRIWHNVRFFHFYSSKSFTQFLSYIEIWENFGDSINPDYQGTTMNSSNDHEFDDDRYGEVIRIDHTQCSTLNP